MASILYFAIWWSLCGFSCVYSHSRSAVCCVSTLWNCLQSTKFVLQAINSGSMGNILSHVCYCSAAIFVKLSEQHLSLSLHLFSLLLPSLCLYWTHRGHPSLWQQFMQAILYFWITQASVWWRVEARSMFCHCEGKLMHNAQTTWQITTLFSSRLHPWLFWRGKKKVTGVWKEKCSGEKKKKTDSYSNLTQ